MKRKLATILAADVAGYSRLMAEDEEATLQTLGAYRDTIGNLVSEHSGRVFGAAGDSMVAEFASRSRRSAPPSRSSARFIAATPIFRKAGVWNSGSASISATS